MAAIIRRIARHGAELVVLAAATACSNAGNIGAGGQANQVSGVVRGVDARSQQIGLQLSNGQTVGLQYDNNTEVIYQNRRYGITSLDAGDQVTARIQQNGNAYYTDLVQVDQPVQGSANGATSSGNVQQLTGTVRQIDQTNGWFTLNTSSYGTVTVSLPYNVNRADQSRFQNLRSGDAVRLYGVFLNDSRVELRQFY
jgi:Cu/Ag efflux protein CusF